MAHFSYVICDECGAPGTDPVGNSKEARRLLPLSWQRRFSTSRGRYIDLCPKHARMNASSEEG